ncbi:MAG TPA: glycerophosphodiester phosphodiesterase [Bryobacteraceae bacterium]|nr:glycerophosphodiester phosphodiesterase [Bryobacteraceae bacterium]
MRVLIVIVLAAAMVLEAAPRKVLVHGHRGARAVFPENTLPAFEHAIAAGADVLELDLAVTKDNVLVVTHDPVINSTLCKGPRENPPIRELTLEQVRQYDCGSIRHPAYPKQRTVPGATIPTLDEVLALADKGTFDFNIETKIFRHAPEYTPPPEEFVKLLLEAVKKRNLQKRVILQSFDFRTLHAMRKLGPGIRLAALYEGQPKDFADIAEEAHARIVAPQFRLVSKERVEQAHAAGLQIIPWTANNPEDWELLLAAGVDAIITDDPAALIEWLKTH